MVLTPMPVVTSSTVLPAGSAKLSPVPARTGPIDAFSAAMARQSPVPAGGADGLSFGQRSSVVDQGDEGVMQEPSIPDAPAVRSGGDVILDGLQQLRTAFDVREERIAGLMSSTSVNANTLMAMQVEAANFTLLTDVASKLAGKSTQAIDTLMKGQ